MEDKVNALLEYFSTNGTLSEAVNFSQLIAAQAWGQIAKLYTVMQGVI